MSQIFAQATPRTQAPYRNDVVGSFLRTDVLKNAKIELQTGKINQAAFDKILKDEIQNLVNLQKRHGLHAVTDGEFSRVWWHLFFSGAKWH